MKIDLETINYEEQDNIAYLNLNCPPANIMTPCFLKEIVEIIFEYAVCTRMKGIIISGKGKHFSSGADLDMLLKWVNETSLIDSPKQDLSPQWNNDVKSAFEALYQCEIPVISVIKGFCIGSGYELTLHSHIRIAEKGARVGLPEATFDLLPGLNGTLRCIEEVGYKKAFEIIFKGELITAEEAVLLGLVDFMTNKKEATTLAVQFIKFMAEYSGKYCFMNAKRIFSSFQKSSNVDD